MEMHSRQSLHEIHGISAPPWRRSRSRSIARLGIALILAILNTIMKAIEADGRPVTPSLISPAWMIACSAISHLPERI